MRFCTRGYIIYYISVVRNGSITTGDPFRMLGGAVFLEPPDATRPVESHNGIVLQFSVISPPFAATLSAVFAAEGEAPRSAKVTGELGPSSRAAGGNAGVAVIPRGTVLLGEQSHRVDKSLATSFSSDIDSHLKTVWYETAVSVWSCNPYNDLCYS